MNMYIGFIEYIAKVRQKAQTLKQSVGNAVMDTTTRYKINRQCGYECDDDMAWLMHKGSCTTCLGGYCHEMGR